MAGQPESMAWAAWKASRGLSPGSDIRSRAPRATVQSITAKSRAGPPSPIRLNISNLYSKLGVGDRSQAVLYAVRKGLVEP